MGPKQSYTLLSPIYNWVVSAPTEIAHKQSLHQFSEQITGKPILINGTASELDIPFLNETSFYTSMENTPAMPDEWFRHIELKKRQ